MTMETDGCPESEQGAGKKAIRKCTHNFRAKYRLDTIYVALRGAVWKEQWGKANKFSGVAYEKNDHCGVLFLLFDRKITG
jgi:hypothetical protein